MSDTPEYISHDYSPLNKQIEELAKRESHLSESLRIINQTQETKNLVEKIKYTCLGLLALGILALFVAWAIRLIIYRPAYKDIEIVRPEVVTQTIERVIERDRSDNSDTDVIRRINESEGENTNPSPMTPAGGKVVVNYVKFTFVETDEYPGINSVATGRNYDSENDTYPESQFCYIMKPVYGQPGPVQIELSTVDGAGKKTTYVDSNLARLSAIPLDSLIKLERLCSFRSKNV